MLTYAPNSFMGVNLNSPTVQGIIQQNNQQNIYGQQMSFSQPQQIGNIGGYGYNNGINPYTNQPQFNQLNIYGQQMQYPYGMNPYNQNQIMNGGYYSG